MIAFPDTEWTLRLKQSSKNKLTPKDDKALYSQNLVVLIHLEEGLIFELALMHKNVIITILPISKCARLNFAPRKPKGKIQLLVGLRKNNILIADNSTNNNRRVRLRQTQHNIWQGSLSFACSTAPSRIIFCR